MTDPVQAERVTSELPLRATVLGFRFDNPSVEAGWQRSRLPHAQRINSTACLVFAAISFAFLVVDLVAIGLPMQVQVMRGVTIALGLFGVWYFRRVDGIDRSDLAITITTTFAFALFWLLLLVALPEQDLRDYWLPGVVLMTAGCFVVLEVPFSARLWLALVNGTMAGVCAFQLEISVREHVIALVHEVAVLGISWLGAWQTERSRREAFWQHEVAEAQREVAVAEKDRADGLLHNILPSTIAELLMSQPGTIARRHPDVTVLFADLVGFTPMSAKLPAEQVVDHLDAIFTAFDHLCDKHGVEKIKTIGDAYMVAGGVPGAREDHAVAVAEMALEMNEVVAEAAARLGADLQLRIGLNSGPVVAGVIGKRKFIYDLWGDTVNTASRMESHGEAGRVHVSEETAKRLGDVFSLQARGQIEVKGKGPMSTFFVQPRAQPATSTTPATTGPAQAREPAQA